MSYTVTFPGGSYEDALDSFGWDVPEDYDAARNLVGKHADADDRVALYQGYPDGRRETFTFHDVDVRSNQVARSDHPAPSIHVQTGSVHPPVAFCVIRPPSPNEPISR